MRPWNGQVGQETSPLSGQFSAIAIHSLRELTRKLAL